MVDSGAWSAEDVRRVLRMPTDSDDKYSRGVIGIRTGSDAYPGAAVLGVEAAWRTGTGMVRYLGPEAPSRLVLQRRPETVTADGRVQAWLIGSGMDADSRPSAVTEAVRGLLNGTVPVVVDAGALDLVVDGTAPRVITPHAGELARVRAALGLDPDRAAGVESAVETAAALGATVLLKGATTVVATPAGRVIQVRAGTPWLATAGSGDVLGGVLGALVAAAGADAERTDGASAVKEGALTPETLGPLAASAAWLHGRAGVAAVRAAGGGPIAALDIAEALPGVVGSVLLGS